MCVCLCGEGGGGEGVGGCLLWRRFLRVRESSCLRTPGVIPIMAYIRESSARNGVPFKGLGILKGGISLVEIY